MPTGPDPLSAAFGAAIRELRIHRGLSQEALAQAIQVQRTYVVDVERGRRNMTLRNISRFASALEVTLGELMTEVDEEFRSRQS